MESDKATTVVEQDTVDMEGGGESSIIKDVGGGITIEQVRELERAAELLPAMKNAMTKILVLSTYQSDWIIQGDTACLKSAGAERVASALGSFDWYEHRAAVKEEFEDKHGQGYIWKYHYRVHWKNRSVDAVGMYSSRDGFFGKAGGEWRDVADINEANVQRAARHIAIGEGIKQLLGLRGMPVEMMPKFGMKTEGMKKVEREEADPDEQKKRGQISSMLRAMNEGDEDAAKAHLQKITEFKGREGKIVKGLYSTKALKGKRLEITYAKVKEEYEATFGVNPQGTAGSTEQEDQSVEDHQ